MKPFCAWFMCVVGVCVLVGTQGPAFAQELTVPVVLEDGRLYLQAETVETVREANLLDDPDTISRTDRVRVLVLDRALHPRLKDQLEALGVELLDYLPQHSFTVRLTGVDASDLAAVQLRTLTCLGAWVHGYGQHGIRHS